MVLCKYSVNPFKNKNERKYERENISGSLPHSLNCCPCFVLFSAIKTGQVFCLLMAVSLVGETTELCRSV